MNRRVYAYVRIYAFLYAYTRIFIRTYANTYTHIRVYLYVYTRILIRTYAYTYTHIRVYLFAYYTRFLVNVYLSGTVVFFRLAVSSQTVTIDLYLKWLHCGTSDNTPLYYTCDCHRLALLIKLICMLLKCKYILDKNCAILAVKAKLFCPKKFSPGLECSYGKIFLPVT